MPESESRFLPNILDPPERISEILFGLIMALTFTGSISVASGDRAEVRDLLVGAIGCNLAWGIVDAVMYLTAGLVERGRNLKVLHAIRRTADPGAGQRLIADALPPTISAILGPDQFEFLRRKLVELPDPPERPRLRASDFLGAFSVCLLVFLSTFPVVVPFLFIDEVHRALRVSNGIAVGMLFLGGHALGRYAGHRPWRMGLWMVALGCTLVALTIALGG
ncbi:MAG TPA: VIT1/CCC1 transporter family protein [Acidobacteriota bacterium]|jgi:VIT1/CCC1 family predicted Fe2+/Mn2+ transporter|nr:VIT1/CCC1 transporter family protein [Acidobacteriota bacterium]HNR38613.1 VIT1/CCC1 transporter family protein [Acidobacteriota bacterium]HNU01189.1 VIT1/CCC1 transporter family protein [Acidobacteriota bacterium]HPB29741.1 VIT1/CCC1 transporter family protein [Acidobacteriota bacterium]HQO25275.1 VIT1/CCC1 transporter family protein [Acidobacteriota bacterium]